MKVFVAIHNEAYVSHESFVGVWQTLEEAFLGVSNSWADDPVIVSDQYNLDIGLHEDVIVIMEREI